MGLKKVIKLIVSLVFIVAVLLLCLSGPFKEHTGAVEYLIGSAKVELTGGRFETDTKYLSTVISEQDIPMLRYFTKLEYADFSGSRCYSAIADWSAENPQIEVKYAIPMPNGSNVDSGIEQLDLSWLETKDIPQMVETLGYLKNLRTIELGSLGGERLELGALAELSAAVSGVDFHFSVNILGREIDSDAESIDLSGLNHNEAADTAAILSCMSQLSSVDLGAEKAGRDLQWQDIALLKAACPDARFSYSFNLYGQEHTLDSAKLDFRGVEVKDNGDILYSVLPCMNNCTYLDMDSTGVDNEALAKLRDLFPHIEVVWRVWFGENYSVRTDTERILASKPTVGGMIYDASPLQYCTKVKYLDLGHNDELADFSFLANMPDLEVVIISMTAVTDISALKNCTKLDYLELNSTNVSDLSPLAGCTAIKHMNIACCPNIDDISPLYSITGMERLWIGNETPVAAEQVAQMRQAAPGCNINTSTSDPHGESWRFTGYDPEIPLYYWVDRYEILREQLGYNYQEYSFYWLDPYCDLEAPAEHAGKYGKEVYGL